MYIFLLSTNASARRESRGKANIENSQFLMLSRQVASLLYPSSLFTVQAALSGPTTARALTPQMHAWRSNRLQIHNLRVVAAIWSQMSCRVAIPPVEESTTFLTIIRVLYLNQRLTPDIIPCLIVVGHLCSASHRPHQNYC